MTRELSSSVEVRVTGTLQNLMSDGVNTASKPIQYSIGGALANGVGQDQADRVWADEARTLADAASVVVDVFDFAGEDIGAGNGNDMLGQPMQLDSITTIIIQVDDTSEGSLEVGGEGSTAAWNSIFDGSDTAKITLPPNSSFVLHNPSAAAYDVTDGSNHLLKFAAVGGAVDYKLWIIGRGVEESSDSSSSISVSSSSSSSSSSGSSSSSSSSVTSSSSSSNSSSSSSSSSSSGSSSSSNSSSSTSSNSSSSSSSSSASSNSSSDSSMSSSSSSSVA